MRKLFLGKPHEFTVHRAGHRCGARFVHQQAHFADTLTGNDAAPSDNRALSILDENRKPALHKNVIIRPRIALPHERLSGREENHFRCRSNSDQILFADAGEQRGPA